MLLSKRRLSPFSGGGFVGDRSFLRGGAPPVGGLLWLTFSLGSSPMASFVGGGSALKQELQSRKDFLLSPFSGGGFVGDRSFLRGGAPPVGGLLWLTFSLGSSPMASFVGGGSALKQELLKSCSVAASSVTAAFSFAGGGSAGCPALEQELLLISDIGV